MTDKDHLLRISKLHDKEKLEYLATLIKDKAVEISETKIDHITARNLVVIVKGVKQPDKKVLVTAHHDVVNKKAQNCLDNNGSVLNLINIINRIDKPECTIILAVTDHEEMVSTRYNGISLIMDQHKIHQHLDLELTPSGKIPVISPYNEFYLLEDYTIVPQPANNALIMTRHKNRARGSACITLLDESDMLEYNHKKFCSRWSNCHKESDTIERWHNQEDCDVFVDHISKIVSSYGAE